MLVDRLPPHSVEAEQGVLGCCLLEPRTSMPAAATILKDGPLCFYDLRHRTIYEAMLKLEGKEWDLIILQQVLKDAHQLEAVGGIIYLSSLPDCTAGGTLVDHYAQLVMDKYIMRRAIQVCTELVGATYEHAGPVEELIEQFEKDASTISSHLAADADWSIRGSVHQAISDIETLHQNAGTISGISTGLVDLDKLTGGLQDAEMIVIGARPSMGKSSLLFNIAEYVAVDLKTPVGIFSMEMSKRSLMLRLLCSRARVNLRNVRDGFLAERDFPKLTGAAGKLLSCPLFIDDSCGLSLLQLRARARRMKMQHGIKLLGIDYLQLLNCQTNKRFTNRQEEVSAISSGVKSLAKELNIPIIVLCQLNRDMEREKGRKPRLSDLRESGSVEQDADVVGLLYKTQRDEDDDGYETDAIPVNLYIAKQRNGPTGDVALTFLRSYTRFESAARISSDDVETQGNLPYPDHD